MLYLLTDLKIQTAHFTNMKTECSDLQRFSNDIYSYWYLWNF